MKQQNKESLENIKKKASKKDQVRHQKNKPNSANAAMFKEFLEAVLNVELEAQIKEDATNKIANRKNGRVSKILKIVDGEFELTISRDRNGCFEPLIIKKRLVSLPENLQNQIIELYTLGTSTQLISEYIESMYSEPISPELLSAITESVTPLINKRQKRGLKSI